MNDSAQTRPLLNACLDRDVLLLLLGRSSRGGVRVGEPGLFGRRQPLGVRGAVLQVEPRDDADDDGRDRHAEEHEAPALEAEEHAVLLDEEAGERGAEDGRERLRQVEEREDLAAVHRGHPEAEEEDGAGEEARLGDAEEEPQRSELLEVLHPGEQERPRCPSSP